jgi:hypothetical protein
MVPKARLDASQDELAAARQEADRLGKALQASVTKAKYDAAQDEISKGADEVQRLQKLLGGMVPKARLDSAQDQLAGREKECEELRKRLECMVAKGLLDRCEDEVRRLSEEMSTLVSRATLEAASKAAAARVEAAQADTQVALEDIERLKKTMEGMVTKAKLDAAQDEIRKGAEEAERLRQQVAAMIPKSRLEMALKEATDRAAEIERLQGFIATMVSRAVLEKSEDEVRRLQAEIARLVREIGDLKDKVEQLLAPLPPVFEFESRRFEEPFALMVYSANADAMIYCTLDGSEPGPENRASVFGQTPLTVAIPDETTEAKAVCVCLGRRGPATSRRFTKAEKRERAAPPRDDAGIGIVFEVVRVAGPGPNQVTIKEVVPGGAAAVHGCIEPGDHILAVDDEDVSHLDTDDIAALIRGVEGSAVRLTLLRPDADGGPGAGPSSTVTLLRTISPSHTIVVLPPVATPTTVTPGRTPLSRDSAWPQVSDVWKHQSSWVSLETFFPLSKNRPAPTPATTFPDGPGRTSSTRTTTDSVSHCPQ